MKRWKVGCSDWYGGEFRLFWLKSSAIKHINLVKNDWLFIDLIDLWKGKAIRVKDTMSSDYYRTESGEYIRINN